MNVMMKSPVTSTPAREARNSTVVSRGFSSLGVSFCFSVLGTFDIRFRKISSQRTTRNVRDQRVSSKK